MIKENLYLMAVFKKYTDDGKALMYDWVVIYIHSPLMKQGRLFYEY